MAKVTPDEQRIITNSLGLQAASYKRSINAAISNKDSVLQLHYETEYQKVLNLINRVNNLELPL